MQQRVEILKALFRGAHVLILDEPTGVLTPQEADHLFRILRNLKAQGRTIVLITHKLREIMAVTDQVSVMRAGAMVAHRQTAETSKEELAELMVGRKVLLRVEKGPARPREPVLEVRDLEVARRPGRAAGQGHQLRRPRRRDRRHRRRRRQRPVASCWTRWPASAARRAARSCCAALPITERRPGAACCGCAHVPEDRLRVGLVQGLHRLRERDPRLPDRARLRASTASCGSARSSTSAARWMRGYDVRPQEPLLEAHSFSGGNQQKLVLAREMEHDPDLLLVGQPTRGVDIGAIEFIHKRLIAMRDAGKAVLLVSVELDEILSLADRILVMFDGTITGELRGEADERRIGLLMAGITRGGVGPVA